MGGQNTTVAGPAVEVLVYSGDAELIERIGSITGNGGCEPASTPEQVKQALAGRSAFGVIFIDLATIAKDDLQPVSSAINSIPGVLVVLLSHDGKAGLPPGSNLSVRYCRIKRDFSRQQGPRMMAMVMKVYRGADGPQARGSAAKSPGGITPLLKYLVTGLASAAIAVPVTYVYLSGRDSRDSTGPQTATMTVEEQADSAGREPARNPEPDSDPLQAQIPSLMARADAAIQAQEYFKPEELSAARYFTRALQLDPGNTELIESIHEFIGLVMRDVDSALEEHHLQTAVNTVDKLRKLLPDDPRILDFNERLKQQVNETIAQAKTLAAQGKVDEARPMLAEAAAVLSIDPALLADLDSAEQANRQNRARELADLAIARLEQGRLLEPPRDNAKHYLYSLKRIDPDNEALKLGYKDLGRQLLQRVDRDIARNRLDEAERWLNEARLLDVLKQEVAQRSDALNEALQTERLKIAAENREKRIQALLDGMQSQIAAGRLLQPEGDNARNTLDRLLETAPADDRVSIAAADYNRALLARADEVVQSGNYERAESMLAAANATFLAGDAELGQQLAALKQAVIARQQPQAAADASSGSAVDGVTAKPEPQEKPVKLVHSVRPEYPRKAVRRQTEGWVHVGFDIDARGRTSNITVVEAEPEGLFEHAAIDAVEKFRFEIDEQARSPDFSYHEEILLRFKLE